MKWYLSNSENTISYFHQILPSNQIEEIVEEIATDLKIISQNPTKLDVLYNVTKSLMRE